MAKKLSFPVVFVMLFGVVLSACGPGGATNEQKPLVILQGVDANTLDPHQQSATTEVNISLALFDGLVMFDENLKPIPWLATEWNMIDDTTWEFKIREGVKAHNGEAIDANDVAYSMNRIMDPANEAKGSTVWNVGVMNLDHVEVVDDQTVHFVLTAPQPDLPTLLLASMPVLPQDYYSSTPLEELALKPVGTGPYKLVEWKKGESLTMEANEDYWAGEPEIKKVIYRPVPELSARIAELNTGNADIIVNMQPDLRDQIDPEYATLKSVEGLRRIYLGFVFYGPNAEFLKDQRVRQALNYGVDVQKVLDALIGAGERTGTFANKPNQAPSVQPYPFDPDKAKALLADAGFEDQDGDGFVDYPDGSPIKLTTQTMVNRYVKDLELVQAVADDLIELGVNVEVQPMDWSVYSAQLPDAKLTGDLYLMGSGTGFTCHGDLGDFWTPGGFLMGSYENATFDALYAELGETVDLAKRQELCYQIQEYMHDDTPMIFMYMQVDFYGVSNRLDWQPLPNERIDLFHARFKSE